MIRAALRLLSLPARLRRRAWLREERARRRRDRASRKLWELYRSAPTHLDAARVLSVLMVGGFR